MEAPTRKRKMQQLFNIIYSYEIDWPLLLITNLKHRIYFALENQHSDLLKLQSR